MWENIANKTVPRRCHDGSRQFHATNGIRKTVPPRFHDGSRRFHVGKSIFCHPTAEGLSTHTHVQMQCSTTVPDRPFHGMGLVNLGCIPAESDDIIIQVDGSHSLGFLRKACSWDGFVGSP